MNIALLHMNPTVGDLAGNAKLIADVYGKAQKHDAGLVVTPELALLGLSAAGPVAQNEFHSRQLGRIAAIGGRPRVVRHK